LRLNELLDSTSLGFSPTSLRLCQEPPRVSSCHRKIPSKSITASHQYSWI